MPTAASSTDPAADPRAPRVVTPPRAPWPSRAAREAWRSVVDVTHLLRFRTGTVRRRGVSGAVLLVATAITLAVALVPQQVDGSGGGGRASDLLVLLPTGYAGFLLLTVASAIASGGGRELLHREEGVAFPVSPTTDHLGALLLAPLNIAWILQAWLLVGTTSYAVEAGQLLPALVGLVLWLLAATAMAQVVAWTVEWVRRRPHGLLSIRVVGLALLGAGVALQVGGLMATALNRVPTLQLVAGLVNGWGPRWWLTASLLLVLLLGSVALGAWPAHLAARRAPRDEARVESGSYTARREPRSALAGLVRTDRASIWRAVPMRRGVAVLAVGPGLVALLGDLDWSQLTILPGLVASGGALLFGVNAWCLDARGSLWRESLPVEPWQVFTARAWTLAEFLLAASAVTLALAALRAGTPTPTELVALLATWVVVVLQVVATAMRWSARRPYAADLRSARATPAPPVAMVSYSGKLAVTTTLTSLVFSGLARTDHPEVVVVVAAPFVLWSGVRLLRARDVWADPVARARVVMTVSG